MQTVYDTAIAPCPPQSRKNVQVIIDFAPKCQRPQPQTNSTNNKKEQDRWRHEEMRTRGVTVCAVLAALRSLRSAAQPQHHALMSA